MTVWNFVETALWRAVPGLGTSGYSTYDIGDALPLPFYAAHAGTLDVPDPVPSSLSFNAVPNPYPFTSIVPGSDTDFSFAIPAGVTTQLPGMCIACGDTTALGLNFDGTLISGRIDIASWYDDLIMPISNSVVALGFAASDGEVLGCGNTQCFYSGHWDVVHTPEPGFGVTFIALALIALVSIRYRNRRL